ncbi:GMC family oxidoreductase N-terminal domain-containing protein [Herbaspirillum lusitanum]|uniref:GMC family oxidoreductase N-terminal domain-containing protein n=1 Tax=Herbaspirillum lusitanum TaxID=213312 RepID=A0ABW9A8E9_9BURK
MKSSNSNSGGAGTAAQQDSGDSFDYVIVGAGAAGAILANRLSADPTVSVCLLEAGPRDWHPFLRIPAGFIKIISNKSFVWPITTEPGTYTAGRRVPLPQGRTLGGTTAINGMIYNRGQAADYDGWAAAGNPGWSYAEVLPYFKRSEQSSIGDARYHGRQGPLAVSALKWIHPICEAFIQGAANAGIRRNEDYNGAQQEGVGYFQRTIKGRWRVSTAQAFLKPIRARRNLEIRTDSQSTALILKGKQAVGVRYVVQRDLAQPQQVFARREVIVCGGAINTPKLLQLSGIGPAPLLQALGIPLQHELPGVGANLKDHFSVRLVARVRNSKTINEMARGFGLFGQVLRWLAGRPSLLSVSPSLVHWFTRSNEQQPRANLQGVFSPASYKEGYLGLLDGFPGMTVGVWDHQPLSSGFVHARSADPLQDPIVQPNYLEHPHDRKVLLEGMRKARTLLRTPELNNFFVEETLPGAQVTSDEALLAFASRYGVSACHICGTAKMGPASDPMAVVDHELKVHGLHGLRVVDASVMPAQPSANTCAATMMIAEKAADLILHARQRKDAGSATLDTDVDANANAQTAAHRVNH